MAYGILKVLIILAFVGGTTATTVWLPMLWHRLMTEVGLVLVVPILIFIGAQIAVVTWLSGRQDPVLSGTGKVLGKVLQYLSLFEGLVFTALVLWIVAVLFNYADPPTRQSFASEFAIGVGYVSCFIYGATGGTAMMMAERGGTRWLGALYTVVAIGGPIAVLNIWYDPIQAMAQQAPSRLIVLALAYFAAASVVGMWLMERDVKPKGARSTAGPAGKLPG